MMLTEPDLKIFIFFLSSALLAISLLPYPVFGAGKNDLFLGVSGEEISLSSDLVGPKMGGKIELLTEGNLLGGILFKERFKTARGWDFSPFILSSLDLKSEGLKVWGGMKGKFFSYQLGSWMLKSNISVLTDLSGYRFDGRGQFSLGNYRGVGLFRVNAGQTTNTLWPGDRFTNYRRAALFGSFTPFNRPRGNYGYLELIRNLNLGEYRGGLSGGLGYFSSTKSFPEIHYTARFNFEQSFLSVVAAGFELRSWALYLDNSKLTIAMTGTAFERKTSLLIGYDFPPKIELELSSEMDEIMEISLVLKSN